jgi:DNA-binding transcriptional LysR family regulator
VGNRELVFQRVLDHKVDVAVTGRIPDDERFAGVDFADNEFVLITSAGDPLARRRWVAIEELEPRPWLLREPGSGTLGSNGAIKQAARARLGVALQSRAAVELELKLGLLATITPRGGLPERRWHVVRSAIGPVREDVEAFMAFCTSPAARHALAG